MPFTDQAQLGPRGAQDVVALWRQPWIPVGYRPWTTSERRRLDPCARPSAAVGLCDEGLVARHDGRLSVGVTGGDGILGVDLESPRRWVRLS